MREQQRGWGAVIAVWVAVVIVGIFALVVAGWATPEAAVESVQWDRDTSCSVAMAATRGTLAILGEEEAEWVSDIESGRYSATRAALNILSGTLDQLEAIEPLYAHCPARRYDEFVGVLSVSRESLREMEAACLATFEPDNPDLCQGRWS